MSQHSKNAAATHSVLQLLANTEIDALLTKHQAKMVGYWPNKNEAKICKISPKHILNASQVNI